MTGIREPKRKGSKVDNFPTPALMAVKKLARNICESKIELGQSKKIAGARAVCETHRRIPSFRNAWERITGKSWPGDEWFQSRIDHQSDSQENKASHMRIEQVVEHLTMDGRVFDTWEEWESLVNDGDLGKGPQQYWAYLLLFSPDQNRSVYTIQKIGVTSNLSARYIEHASRGERGEYCGGIGLWSAPSYLITCCIGTMTYRDAQMLEKKYIAAMGNGQPPSYGMEWFRMSSRQACAAVIKILHQEGLDPDIDFEFLGRIK